MSNKYKIIGFIFFVFFIISFIGCNSLPRNVSRKEYDAVRDYVSIKVSGLPYWKLYEELKKQEPPRFYYDGDVWPHYTEAPGSDYVKYNEYMLEISVKMNRLTSRYNKTDRAEDFYSWAVKQE
jgi:hypothetical protein